LGPGAWKGIAGIMDGTVVQAVTAGMGRVSGGRIGEDAGVGPAEAGMAVTAGMGRSALTRGRGAVAGSGSRGACCAT
jgi:hypothetical protein